MPIARFVQPDGDDATCDVRAGDSIMRTAVEHGIPGIVGECGGSLSCATCHVYVESGAAGLPISDDEEEMLAWTASPRLPTSRLSCQLVPGPEDVVVVLVPPTQY
ncbi:2Fe-2S iron-sulfur cluster-binding protein [Streptomyces spongiae]|uniref:(2Fe-2S)-binding protein n=1 Tax=Streptomyces spongiae TaxID=565072 RepID=A0A5N8XAG1_9ACTN|nr:2Fe-2S iron-sulfur cluster-binding protein [Streptomyces spongiae]MPY56377.1 (2Fe-2S)-binding protein [Streptomyces spongiae]